MYGASFGIAAGDFIGAAIGSTACSPRVYRSQTEITCVAPASASAGSFFAQVRITIFK